MASSTASVIHSDTKYLYDVFLNFRGDTRLTFTSHLYMALINGKINTYKDDKLVKGVEIAPALLKAIEGSKISVIIFSEQYASSEWCLNELVHIMECYERKKVTVIPIFYNVDPTVVRQQKGKFELENLFNDRTEIERRLKWKDALTKASNLSGFHIGQHSNESRCIGKVVKDISGKLAMPESSVVSMGFSESFLHQFAEILSLLQFLPRDDLVRSAFTDVSLHFSSPYDAAFLITIETLHNLPKTLVRLSQTNSGQTLLIMLLMTLPFT